MVRSTGAIFWLTRPATIIRSAWRGVAEKRSIPKRAMSKRGPPTAIISMAQQARPKVAGHMEVLRTKPTICSTVVSRTPLGSFSSRPISRTPFPVLQSQWDDWGSGAGWSCGSVPFEAAAAPFVGVGDRDVDEEQDHHDQAEDPERVEVHRPGH